MYARHESARTGPNTGGYRVLVLAAAVVVTASATTSCTNLAATTTAPLPSTTTAEEVVGEQLAPSYNVAPTLTDSERVRELLDSVPACAPGPDAFAHHPYLTGLREDLYGLDPLGDTPRQVSSRVSPARNTSGLGPCPDRLRITLDLFTAVAQPASRAIS